MKNLLTITLSLLLLSSSSIQAQILREYDGANNIPMGNTDIQIGDFNSDNILDILVPSNEYPLAINDGTGHFFQDYSSKMEGVGIGAYVSAVGDLDGDGDLDLVTATGEFFPSPGNQKLVKIYFNDGLGNFDLDDDQLFEGLVEGDLEIADLDQDGDLDIYHTGITGPCTGEMYTYFLINNGVGQFTYEIQPTLAGMCEGDAALQDLTGDGAPDILITGITMVDSFALMDTAFYYINDGTGHFDMSSSFDMPNVQDGHVGVVDIDQDGDNDLVLLSSQNGDEVKAMLFLNDGNGAFNESIELPASIPYEAHFEFGDIDNDGNTDMVLMGGYNQKAVAVLLNKGNYQFELKTDHNIKPTFEPHFKLLDADDNGTLDLVQAFDSGIYYNDGTGSFDNQYVWFENLYLATMEKVDINDDNYPDIIHSGINEEMLTVVNVHINTQDKRFEFSSRLYEGDEEVLDIAAVHLNEDEYIDIVVLTDATPSERIHYFLNQNNESFSEVNLNLFDAGYWTHIIAKDLNQDGSTYVLLSGASLNSGLASQVYQAIGSGDYEKVKTLDTRIERIEALHIDEDNIIDHAFFTKESISPNTYQLMISIGGGSWDNFLEQQELLSVEYHILPADILDMNVIEDQEGLYILLNSDRNILFKQDETGSFVQEYEIFLDSSEEILMYLGDLNDDGIADYLHTLAEDQGDPSSVVVNVMDGELIAIDSVLAPDRNFLRQFLEYQTLADFDLDGDVDVLILESNGEVNYLVNQSQEPSTIFDLEEEGFFSISPNPVVQSSLNIRFPEDWQGEKHYMIFNKLGQLLQRGPLSSQGIAQQQEIELNLIQTGMYRILVYSKDKRSSESFFFQD